MESSCARREPQGRVTAASENSWLPRVSTVCYTKAPPPKKKTSDCVCDGLYMYDFVYLVSSHVIDRLRRRCC
jgi:hypothetical protein